MRQTEIVDDYGGGDVRKLHGYKIVLLKGAQNIIKTAIDFHYMLNMRQMCVKYERSKKLYFFSLLVLQGKFSFFSLEILLP